MGRGHRGRPGRHRRAGRIPPAPIVDGEVPVADPRQGAAAASASARRADAPHVGRRRPRKPGGLRRGLAAEGEGRGPATASGRPHDPARSARGGRARRRGVRRLVTLLVGSAFVTGGGSGIGRAIAQALASHGAPVAVMDLLPEGGKDAVAAIAAKGGRATLVQGDVGRWDELDRAVAAAVRELGPLGIVVNAAGVLDGYAPADEIGPALWERVIGINLTGTFYGCKRALAEMLPRGRGRIVNIASVAGLVGSGGGAAYTASKP